MNPNNSITEFSNQLLDACVEHRKQLAEKEVARLREALKPFLKIANGIPENWPEQCILRFDQRNDGSLYVNYYGVQEASDGITIKQWRDLAQSPEKTNEVARLQAETDRLYIVAQEASESAQRKSNEVERLRELLERLCDSVSENWDEGIANYFREEANKPHNQ